MALVFGRRPVEICGVPSVSFLDDPKYGLADPADARPRRTRWVRSIVFHTRMGIWPQDIVPGGEAKGWDEVLARRFTRSERAAGAHIAIDADGSFCCLADLVDTTTHHAGQVNDLSIGVEMYQDTEGRVWEATLETAVTIADVLTRELGIQRQFAVDRQLVTRLASPRKRRGTRVNRAYRRGGLSGMDYCGLFGHRNATRNRGLGDPGDQIWVMLQAAGYEPWELELGEDLQVWAERQRDLGFDEDERDGIPGPLTRRALLDAGHPHGLWVQRPGD